MAHFNPCCCDEGCFGVIGYDLYNTQIQNFTGVFIDGKDFNSRPVKFGVCKGLSEFNEFTTPYGDVAMDFVPHPRWQFFNEYRYRCGWPNAFNINKDPVETLWVTPLAQHINFSFTNNNNPYRFIGLSDEYNWPAPQTARFYAKNHTAYGYLVDYAQAAPVQPYLFTSQPGRFVIQTHSEAPDNHYVGLNENGHIACIPYPKDDPNYWASPINHLSPKSPIQNSEGQVLTFKTIARHFAPSFPPPSIDYETIVNPPFDTQPLYPAPTSLEFALHNLLTVAMLTNWDRFKFSKTVGPSAIAGVNLFAPSVKVFQDVADPSSTTPNRRSNSNISFKDIINQAVVGFNGVEPHLCPCKRTFQDVYLPDAPAGAGQQLIITSTPSATNPFPKKTVNSQHPKARMYVWTSPKTWRSYNNKISDPSPQTDFPQYTDYMPDRPPEYFKMPKKGKIFTGPLYPQNRWEAEGTYFGKYSSRGHNNWTQAAWMTWPGGYTLQPTSLLTDPLNKQYYDAEVSAFKKMIKCCASEKNQSTICKDGKWSPTCKDASTLMWSKRYPNRACGVGVTADPPPPCGARKLVWSLYHTNNLYSFNNMDGGIESFPPLAWGDFIFYENLHKDPGATYDYELKTRWVTGDWEKNRCFGFDVPGINLADGATGISAAMPWEEMQGPEWTPIYPTEKSLQKQCFKKNFGSLQRNYDYFQQKFVDFTKFPPNNPFGVAGVTIDPVVIANSQGWFKSYKGITGGLWLTEGPSIVGGWTFSSFFVPFKGECGVRAGNYWEETDDDIFYFLKSRSIPADDFSYISGNYIWLISCSVPQFHKKADQPKTKGTTSTPIDGELTGLGWSKNMAYFSPCGGYSFSIDGPTADIEGVCGSTAVEQFTGFTLSNLTKNISKKYKECHGCTWSNPPTWVGIDSSNGQFPSRSITRAYWAISFPFIGLSNEFPNNPFNDPYYAFFPCSNTVDSFPQSGYLQLYNAVEEASRLEGDCDWLTDASSYANVTFADFRIPYQIGQQTYKTTPPLTGTPPDPLEYTNYAKDSVSTLIFGPPVQYPDPDNRCD